MRDENDNLRSEPALETSRRSVLASSLAGGVLGGFGLSALSTGVASAAHDQPYDGVKRSVWYDDSGNAKAEMQSSVTGAKQLNSGYEQVKQAFSWSCIADNDAGETYAWHPQKLEVRVGSTPSNTGHYFTNVEPHREHDSDPSKQLVAYALDALWDYSAVPVPSPVGLIMDSSGSTVDTGYGNTYIDIDFPSVDNELGAWWQTNFEKHDGSVPSGDHTFTVSMTADFGEYVPQTSSTVKFEKITEYTHTHEATVTVN